MNKKGGIWLFFVIGIIILILVVGAGYFAWKYNQKIYAEKALDEVNEVYISVLKCMKDKAIENENVVTPQIGLDCRRFGSEIVRNELNPEYYGGKTNVDLSKEFPEKYQLLNLLVEATVRDDISYVNSALEEARKFYDIDSINYK